MSAEHANMVNALNIQRWARSHLIQRKGDECRTCWLGECTHPGMVNTLMAQIRSLGEYSSSSRSIHDLWLGKVFGKKEKRKKKLELLTRCYKNILLTWGLLTLDWGTSTLSLSKIVVTNIICLLAFGFFW